MAHQHHVPYGRGPVGRRRPSGGPGVYTRLVAHDPCLPVVHVRGWREERAG
ncbi:hypothetical protein CU044_6989 [Streptomyces sp. L-9-10]|nr:hypothetical protein CU044_6989 [Streptomyces sp. L-9-10]